MGTFTAVDIVVAILILGLAGFSFFRGFVHQVLAIGAWIGAGAITFYGFETARPFFRSHIGSALGADVANVLALFLVSLLILSIVTKAVSDRVRRSALNGVDSSLGFVFGAGLGALLSCLLYLLITSLSGDNPPDWLMEAKTRPWLERGANLVKDVAPQGFGAAEHQGRAIRDQAEDVMEAEQTFRKFVAPQPADPKSDKAGTAPGPVRPYPKDGQSQMDRLIHTNQ